MSAIKPSKKSVTVWDHPNSRIDSQYGDISYRQWCEKEVERMNRNGGNVKLSEHNEFIAITRS